MHHDVGGAHSGGRRRQHGVEPQRGARVDLPVPHHGDEEQRARHQPREEVRPGGGAGDEPRPEDGGVHAVRRRQQCVAPEDGHARRGGERRLQRQPGQVRGPLLPPLPQDWRLESRERRRRRGAELRSGERPAGLEGGAAPGSGVTGRGGLRSAESRGERRFRQGHDGAQEGRARRRAHLRHEGAEEVRRHREGASGAHEDGAQRADGDSPPLRRAAAVRVPDGGQAVPHHGLLQRRLALLPPAQVARLLRAEGQVLRRRAAAGAGAPAQAAHRLP
mmetsp:Transcript_14595/g.55136  ORF Transcript_14595/g.55136 Transcript_14595/m.55136 type:complete len:276 (-) Transcript_14595:468-1295(-)